MPNDVIVDDAIILRFSRYVGNLEPCGCRLWLGGTYSKKKLGQDYGCFRVSAEEGQDGAHRVAYRIHKGPIPPGMIVRHTCDTPRCVAEDHVVLGTHKDNTQDMIRRGRSKLGLFNPIGVDHHSAKLTYAEAIAIRSDPRSQRAIAKAYGISQPQVSYIKRGMSRKSA